MVMNADGTCARKQTAHKGVYSMKSGVLQPSPLVNARYTGSVCSSRYCFTFSCMTWFTSSLLSLVARAPTMIICCRRQMPKDLLVVSELVGFPPGFRCLLTGYVL